MKIEGGLRGKFEKKKNSEINTAIVEILVSQGLSNKSYTTTPIYATAVLLWNGY